MSAGRESRRHTATEDDQRSPFQRDRDRTLYSSSFRRLDGVTQIVRAGESDVFHNRLTHSIKVAQVGRRLAEHCRTEQPSASDLHGIDTEVVEAACLGHDLGHPPFGHIGEQVLDEILTKEKEDGTCLDPEGFEGNAQSFRIVTKLAVRFPLHDGLDLTRATLAALQKYPWKRDKSDDGVRARKDKKWGYYKSEQDDFDFCMDGVEKNTRTLEAELMSWADDIAYSVHDLEDFHRCNFIPWTRIVGESAPAFRALIENCTAEWHDGPSNAGDRIRKAHARLSELFEGFPSVVRAGSYEGTRDQRQAIRMLTSILIGRYVQATKIAEDGDNSDNGLLKVDDDCKDEVRLLKQITRDYILTSPSLAAQQQGQMRVLQNLFEDFHEEIQKREPRVLPRRFHHLVEDDSVSAARTAADCIASLTEREAIALHRRLTGLLSGSVLDPIVR